MLAVLFPGAPHEIIVMGAIMECAKLVASGWLAGLWRHVPRAFRGVLMLLIAGLAVINASGTFSQLTAAHVGGRAVSAASRAVEAPTSTPGSKLPPPSLRMSTDGFRRSMGSWQAAAQRGRANTAAGIMTDQRKARAALVAERQQAAEALADLKVERGNVQAQATVAESEAMPLRYAALRHDKVRMPKMSTATLGSRRCPPPTRRISEQSGGQPSGANSAVTKAASRARYSVARFSGCLALRSKNSA
jgi:hypothetical protein